MFQDMETDRATTPESIRRRALEAYKKELFSVHDFGLGSKSKSRTAMRVVCEGAVLNSSSRVNKKNSIGSILNSSSFSNDNTTGANTSENENILKKLQHERLLVSRLGFPEKAFELDREINYLRNKVRLARARQEAIVLKEMLKGNRA